MINLSDKIVIVTGASSGLGRAISQLAASQGAKVILTGRDEVRLKETLLSLAGDGHRIITGDLADYSFIESIAKFLVDEGITVNGFVHSAGIEKTLPFKSSKPVVFEEIFTINVFAGFELARIISQKNIASSFGASFVFMSSIKAILGAPFNVAYCASKSALLAGSKAIAIELASRKIRCNCILPGIVETEMVKGLFESIPSEAKEKLVNEHPLGLGKPEDVAALAVFLLSDEAKWITGAEYIIDGGFSIH